MEGQGDVRVEGVDDHFSVFLPEVEGVVTALGNNSMRLDASLCRVVASDEKLAARLAVGEPDTVAREEPVWVVGEIEISEGVAWRGTA